MAIAVSFSDTPEGSAALVYAAREAMQRRAQLLVLDIVDDASVTTETEKIRSAVQSVLDAAELGASTWELRVAEHSGDRVGALVDLIADSGVRLFVVGSRRKSPVGKFLLERSVQRLLLEVDVPILVVKPPH